MHRGVFSGVYDPALIGDKPKWYSRNLTSIPFNIIEENNTLADALKQLNDVEHTPSGLELDVRFLVNVRSSISDESGSESEEENPNADYSSLSDFVSEMRNSEICGEIRGEVSPSFVRLIAAFSSGENVSGKPGENRLRRIFDGLQSAG